MECIPQDGKGNLLPVQKKVKETRKEITLQTSLKQSVQGKGEILNCEINEGFYSAALPHLANISYRLGRQLKFMGEYEKFANDPEADLMLTREYRPPYVIPEII